MSNLFDDKGRDGDYRRCVIGGCIIYPLHSRNGRRLRMRRMSDKRLRCSIPCSLPILSTISYPLSIFYLSSLHHLATIGSYYAPSRLNKFMTAGSDCPQPVVANFNIKRRDARERACQKMAIFQQRTGGLLLIFINDSESNFLFVDL